MLLFEHFIMTCLWGLVLNTTSLVNGTVYDISISILLINFKISDALYERDTG